MFLILKEIIMTAVQFITDFVSLRLDAYLYLWFAALFAASFVTTLIQRKEGSVSYRPVECVGINLLAIVLYLVLGTLLAKSVARLEDTLSGNEDNLMFYRISFLLSSVAIGVDIVLDRLKKKRSFSYTLEFFAGSTVCFLAFQIMKLAAFLDPSLPLSYVVLLSISAGIYTISMKYLLEHGVKEEHEHRREQRENPAR
ncbi:DUF5823 family protein [Gorillibacterium sp. CAU 1737]|uniref:DUF5823 family protein n=1 Tax=Gorillibacterium sp. CAU 1737 TaxID=3140362 RepID=UPI0032606323